MRSVSAMQDRETARSAGEALWLAICIAFVAMLVVGGATAARADDDLPGRVGRIADFGGQLYLSAQNSPDDWTPIGINYPVASGDNLYVSSDGRAEIDYGGGQFRLAGGTSVNVARLDDHQLTLFVARGRLIVRIRVLDTEDVARIDTPNTQLELTRPGLYRIEVAPDGSTTKLGVREGEGFVALATGAQQVLPGQMVSVSGIEPLAADFRNGSGADGFDTWSTDRDRLYERARAAPYVSRQMVEFADLDRYGSWEESPVYGPVWYPTVASDWAPYEDGYWTNVGDWGLTWVDSAPWGYAPTHYGRWVRNRGRWGWCPGVYTARPHWAPALVAWYGGAGWGITANGGAPVYAWAPLGWGDAYTPWWRTCSQSCWSRYNKSFGVDPADRANPRTRNSNIDVPGAMTAAPGSTLIGRKPVATTRVPVPASQLASAPMLATPPSVTPRAYAGQVFRPGERGTPTPASAVYSITQRTVFLPAGPRTAAAEPASSGGTRTPVGAAAPLGQPTNARVRAGPALPAGSAAVPLAPVHYGTAVAPAAAYTVTPSAAPYVTRGASAVPNAVPANGIALPAPGVVAPSARVALPPGGVTVPPTGIALPPSTVALPATGLALPPGSPMVPSARAAAVPAQVQQPVVIVVPAAPAVAPQAERGATRGTADADGGRGTRAAAAPGVVPAAPTLR